MHQVQKHVCADPCRSSGQSVHYPHGPTTCRHLLVSTLSDQDLFTRDAEGLDTRADKSHSNPSQQTQAFQSLLSRMCRTAICMHMQITCTATESSKRSSIPSQHWALPHSLLSAQDAEALEIYADMVHQVKAFHGLQDWGLAHPSKIIIAERPQTGPISQRVLTNAREVAAELLKLGYDAQVLAPCCRFMF